MTNATFKVYLEPTPELLGLLMTIKLNTEQIMIDVAKLKADVEAQTTVVQGVVTFINGLKESQATLEAQVADLKAQIAALDDPTLQASLDALDATVQANSQLLRDAQGAIVANTPEA